MASLYHPLDPSKRQFRLLRLTKMPKNYAGPVHCELAVFSLDDRPEFTALSYCWGQIEATCRIIVNGQHLTVRPNLYSYLFLMAQEGETAWTFIDALCINQQDRDERSSQVSLMGDVYRDAAQVTAWLGTEGEFIRDRPDNGTWQNFFDEAYIAMVPAQAAPEGSEPDPSVDRLRSLLDAACGNLLRPLMVQVYWTRLWIVQELIIASKLEIRFRTLRVPWLALCACLQYIGSDIVDMLSADISPGPALEILASGRPLQYFGEMHALLILNQKQSMVRSANSSQVLLSDAILMFAAQTCSMLHDKVFGLLGMTKSVIKPDYSLKPETLYVLVLTEGLHEILARADTDEEPDEDAEQMDRGYRLCIFVACVARALGLDMHEPFIFDLTKDCLTCFGVEYGLWTVSRIFGIYRAKSGGSGSGWTFYRSIPHPILYHLARLRSALSQTASRRLRRERAQVAATVKHVFQTIQQQKTSARAISTAMVEIQSEADAVIRKVLRCSMPAEQPNR